MFLGGLSPIIVITCQRAAEKDTYNLQHCVKVFISLVDEEQEVVGDLHLEDLVRVLLLELHHQRTSCVLDEPAIQVQLEKQNERVVHLLRFSLVRVSLNSTMGSSKDFITLIEASVAPISFMVAGLDTM